MAQKAQWYVIHTYSGYENKVATNLEKIIENRKLEEVICDVRIPTETVVDITEKGKKERERKLFPGYVLVKMVMTDETWYIVRNTRGVTGFVGATTKPIPLTAEEVEKLGVETKTVQCEYEKGMSVKIIDGAMSGFTGEITDITADKQRLKLVVSMFGRETSVELNVGQVSPLE